MKVEIRRNVFLLLKSNPPLRKLRFAATVFFGLLSLIHRCSAVDQRTGTLGLTPGFTAQNGSNVSYSCVLDGKAISFDPDESGETSVPISFDGGSKHTLVVTATGSGEQGAEASFNLRFFDTLDIFFTSYSSSSSSTTTSSSSNPTQLISDVFFSADDGKSTTETHTYTIGVCTSHALDLPFALYGSVTADPALTWMDTFTFPVGYFEYADGSVVKLTATPLSGYTFVGWSGDASGSANPLTVVMDRDKSITPIFINAKVTMMRASPESIGNAEAGILDPDAPLELIPDAMVLKTGTTLGSSGGLIADGVTPLLLSVEAGAPPPHSIDLSFHMDSVTGGNGTLSATILTQHLRVLQDGAFVQDPDNVVTISATGATTGYAYLTALKPEELGLSGGNKEITVQMSVRVASSMKTVSQLTFKIRKPPIVLVHGYHADATTWSANFLFQLRQSYPDTFVLPITYAPDPINTPATLAANATFLDEALSNNPPVPAGPVQAPEDKVSGPYKDWAFTRYDLVCHSQGGVIARMLCTGYVTPSSGAAAPYATQPFRSPENFYRGRFRRVITIGSPHNGSRLLRYLVTLRDRTVPTEWRRLIPEYLADIVQDKFDPFGEQIRTINNPGFQVDPGAQFHAITGTIAGGKAPGNDAAPLVYKLVGLTEDLSSVATTRGQIVLGAGSDGVVDLLSEMGGTGTPASAFPSGDLAHAESPVATPPDFYLFGVPPGQSETSDPLVATEVNRLLNLPSGDPSFGPFTLPTLLDDNTRDAIDSAVPGVIEDAQLATTGAPIRRAAATAAQTSFPFQIVASNSNPLQGSISWTAEVYAPGGVTDQGVSVQLNSSNTTEATVVVDDSVVGDVVLRANFGSSSGKLVLATPIVVVSRAPAARLTGIELVPSSLDVAPGSRVDLRLNKVLADGSRQPVFIPSASNIQYSASNTSVVMVYPDGSLTGLKAGTAMVNVLFAGFTAQSAIQVLPPTLPPAITSPNTASATVGHPFTYQIAASYLPTRYGVDGLPGELTVNGTTGLISGTPKTAGAYSLVLNAYNSVGKGSAKLSLTIKPGSPVITGSLNPPSRQGVPFGYQITATNTPTSYAASGLPGGLGLSRTTGKISGTPTGHGTAVATITATNGAGSGTAKLTIVVKQAVPMITSSLNPPSRQGVPFGYLITATNSPTSFGAAGLPAGLTVNQSTGKISGTPVKAGTYKVTVKATNSGGSGLAQVTVIVKVPAPPVITGNLNPPSRQGVPFGYQITATNSPTSYATQGLPAGLGLKTSTGKISGTPTKAGTYEVMIKATNSGGSGSAKLTITVKAVP